MQKYLIIASVCLLIIWSSCGDQGIDEISISSGIQYIEDNSEVWYTDTFTVETGTVILDSVDTSNSGVALVGKVSNTYYGDIEAQAIFRVSNPSKTDIDLDEDVYDSAVIKMDYEGYYFGDTTQTFEFGLYELLTDVEDIYENDKVIEGVQYSFWNSDVVETEDNPLITYTLSPPRPNKAKDFRIKLPDDWGQEIFEMLGNEEFDDGNSGSFSSDKFYDYLKGFVLKSTSTSNNQSIIGFLASADSMSIDIYINGSVAIQKNADPDDDTYKITISLNENDYQYNTLVGDRSTSTVFPNTDAISNFNQQVNILSGETDNKTFLQGGTGMVTKVRFPSLEWALNSANINSIIKAELILYPINNMEDIQNELPSKLALYYTDKINTNLGYVTSDGDQLFLTKSIDSEGIDNQYLYSADITEAIVNELIDGDYDPEFGFLVAPISSDLQGSLTTLIFGGPNASLKYRPKLKLYTYTYE